QHPEHQHRVIRRAAAFGPVRSPERSLQFRAGQLEIYDCSEPLQRGTGPRKPRQPLIAVEKSPPSCHRPSPPPPAARNQPSPSIASCFSRCPVAATSFASFPTSSVAQEGSGTRFGRSTLRSPR